MPVANYRLVSLYPERLFDVFALAFSLVDRLEQPFSLHKEFFFFNCGVSKGCNAALVHFLAPLKQSMFLALFVLLNAKRESVGICKVPTTHAQSIVELLLFDDGTVCMVCHPSFDWCASLIPTPYSQAAIGVIDSVLFIPFSFVVCLFPNDFSILLPCL